MTSTRSQATARRGTVPFPLERHLVDLLAPVATSFLSQPSVRHHRREVELGRLVADVVAWSDAAPLEGKLSAALRKATIIDLSLLAHLAERPLSQRALARRAHCSETFARQRLSHMERHGLVATGERGIQIPWLATLPCEVVAFEAKLTNWRRAVEQAHYYAQFADHAWVVLPSRRRANDSVRQACVRARVGLLLAEDLVLRREVEPRPDYGSAYDRQLLRLRLLWDSARGKVHA